MPDLLLELFSEEIPARMQAKAADDLRRMVTDKLVAEGLVYEGAKAFATPRRLTLTVHGIPARQSDLKEERKGPRVGGPEAAIAGFLKATGLASLDRGQDPARSEEGRFLHRADRKARPRHARRARRHAAGDHPHLSVAEIDALGRTLGQARRAAMGAAAACHHRHLRHRDRRARCGEVRRSTASRPARPPTAIASWRRRRSTCAASRITRPSCRRRRSCSIRRPARTSSWPTPSSWRSRKALNWSRTRCCSTKSRAWSNGRWC